MMNFKMVTSCPQNVDTIVRYTKYDAAPTFSDPAIQAAFDAALGGDDFGLEPGTVKTFRITVVTNILTKAAIQHSDMI